jgi:hypothetical protein
MIFSFHKNEKGMGQIYGLNNCCLKLIGYNVNHTKIIQAFDKFYIVGV